IQEPPQLFKQRVRMHGFGQIGELVASVGCLLGQFRNRYVAGNKKHLAMRGLIANVNRRVESTDARHENVADKDVGSEVASNCDGFFATESRSGFIAL